MTIFVSYSQQKCFPGKEIERFSTTCISKPPENDVFWIEFCLWVHCIITAVLQVASKRQPERKYPSKADPVLAQLQKYIQKYLSLLFSCAIFGQHTEVDLHCALSHSDPVTPLQHWQFPSPCSLCIFWEEADSPVWKHLLSLHLIFLLPHLSNELFSELPGEWEQVGNGKKKKPKTNSELHLWRRFSPAAFCFGCWSHIHGRQWGDSHWLCSRTQKNSIGGALGVFLVMFMVQKKRSAGACDLANPGHGEQPLLGKHPAPLRAFICPSPTHIKHS